MGIEEIATLRRDISEANFEGFVAEHPVAMVLIHGPDQLDDARLTALAQVCERTAMPGALAAVDAVRCPGILAMFGVVKTPYLLIFRDRIALYAEPVLPTPLGLEGLLNLIQHLDMDRVRADIEVERQAQEALLIRRACPMRRSGPARPSD